VGLPSAAPAVAADAAFAAGMVRAGLSTPAAGAAGAAFAAGTDAAAVGWPMRKPGENKPPALPPLRAAEAGAASAAEVSPPP